MTNIVCKSGKAVKKSVMYLKCCLLMSVDPETTYGAGSEPISLPIIAY